MVGRAVDKEYYRERRQKPFDASRVLVELDNVYRTTGENTNYRCESL